MTRTLVLGPIGSEAAGAAFKDTWTLDDIDLAWHGEIAEQNPAVYEVINAAGVAHRLFLAESHLTRRLFGAMLQRIWALPVPAG